MAHNSRADSKLAKSGRSARGKDIACREQEGIRSTRDIADDRDTREQGCRRDAPRAGCIQVRVWFHRKSAPSCKHVKVLDAEVLGDIPVKQLAEMTLVYQGETDAVIDAYRTL